MPGLMIAIGKAKPGKGKDEDGDEGTFAEAFEALCDAFGVEPKDMAEAGAAFKAAVALADEE